ncbi:MAG: family N-acetyltransferase [Alphaproteobacteria bacterium]|jgi:aminoglycoside 6'-N-acetyltransferase|nr:family N-acetyltransferase [Alphaproteobacteria bacterium]
MITFKSLKDTHLALLLKWLESSHVKKWWDQDIVWTDQLIREKYGTYVDGYKEEKGVRKGMHAYIICVDDQEIGYVQFYNAYDFLREDNVSLKKLGLSESLGALDIFIGEEIFVGKGWGTRIIKKICQEYIDPRFEACFVDPDSTNLQAIRAYEKAGFIKIEKISNNKITCMVRKKQ